MLDRLVQQGLILRTEDPNDRRVKQIEITEKGCQILEAGIQARQSWMNELDDILSDDEQEQIITALTILIEKASQLNYMAEQKINQK